MSVVADLHIHTTASDGLLKPEEVVRRAARLGLTAIAVTDHDTLDGVPEAIQTAAGEYLEVIPGVEFSTELENCEIHILGFYVGDDDFHVVQLLEKLHHSRFSRAEKMVEKLNTLGYRLAWDDVSEQTKGAAPGRPHVARALVKNGYFSSTAAVFESLLGYRMPGYVERYKLTPQEAIAAVRQSGGMAAWAHPGLTGKEKLLAEFVRCGLQGLEVYHPDHGAILIDHYRKLAGKMGLFVCGGSDFHGPNTGHTRELAYCGLSASEFSAFRRYRQDSP